MEILENTIYVYDKNMNLLAICDNDNDGESEESLKNQLVNPIVKTSLNGEDTLSFQVLAQSWLWQQIKHPESIYLVNNRYYTPLNENSYVYSGEGSTRIVSVTCVSTFYLLSKQYHQIFNTGLYVMAKATFQNYVAEGAVFTINANDCSIPGDTLSSQLIWNQVKLWSPTDSKGNKLVYSILQSEENKPQKWETPPIGVFFKDVNISGNTMTVTITSAVTGEVTHNFDYNRNNVYKIDSKPLPTKLTKVYVNITNIASTTQTNTTTYRSYEKDVPYTYNNTTGEFSINYSTSGGETINYVATVYEYCNLGNIEPGATCTFGYGAEVIDEHTFLVLPKADKKYKLTIDGVEYDDSQVRDSRGVIMPRGSGGYAMWAALKNTGWKLGICDVIANGFDTSIDYGCFNLETDQKDTLYNIQNIQQLYGGILNWDSKTKTLNYRGENDTDYEAYNDNYNKWQGYEFRPDKNMTEPPEVTIDNNIITRAYLLGYGGLNVKKVNNGKTYIEDFSYTKDVYEGYLEQPLIYDTRDLGGMNQLLYWGRKELSKMCKPRKSIKFNVFDIRTVEGYEHETFQVGEVVRAYSRESDTDEETYEEKRIVSYEYEVFNRYNATIELGDKVSNLVDLFRLVYNMTMDSPKTDGSGNISANDIVNDRGESLPQYLEIMARTTTSNTDAIAALQLQTTNLYSQVDLFALYQSQLDNLFTKTYAGLSFYADNVGSSIYTKVTGEYKNEIQNTANSLEAGFQASQSQQDGAWAQQFASYTTQVDGKIQTNKAYIETYANELMASITMNVTDTYGGLELTMTSGGIYIQGQYVPQETTSVEIEQKDPEGYEEIYDAIYAMTNGSAFDYYGPTFIDGSMIAAGTVIAGSLQGGTIDILDYRGSTVGEITTEPASSWNGGALSISANAVGVEAYGGDVHLGSRNAFIQIGNDGTIAIVAPNGLTINGVEVEVQ